MSGLKTAEYQGDVKTGRWRNKVKEVVTFKSSSVVEILYHFTHRNLVIPL